MWIFGEQLPKTTLTDRVLEGLASASAVVTTRDECLEHMGLIEGEDYIRINDVNNPKEVLEQFSAEDYARIGANGQKKLKEYLIRQYSNCW
jgi:hypothetical protein